MVTNDKNIKIMHEALDAFKKTTDFNAEIITTPRATYTLQTIKDGLIQITIQGEKLLFEGEVINNLTRAGIILTKLGFDKLDRSGLLVTRYATRKIADQLRKTDVQFIDTAGNAFLNHPPVYIFIKGNKPDKRYQPARPARAFQPTGLRIVFALLCNPKLVEAPLREIAEKADAALGTVGWVMRDLKQMNFIVDMGRRGRRLMNKKELLKRWVAAYPEKLRPKQLIGRYRAKDFDWWEKAELYNFNAFWGGEIAAAKLTSYLKPEIATIYTTQPIEKLLLNYKITNDPAGNIEIIKAFWNFDFDLEQKEMVNPVLIYADLLATGDPRNVKTAEMIYAQQLLRFIRED